MQTLRRGVTRTLNAALRPLGGEVVRAGLVDEKAAERLRALMRAITAWRIENGQAEANGYAADAGDEPPTPPELEMAEALGIEWSDSSLDWAWADADDNTPVTTLDSLVFVDGTESWLGAHPADALVAALGGTALVDGNLDADELGSRAAVVLRLTCTAPSEAEAQAIETAVKRYLEPAYLLNPVTGERYRQPSFDTPWKDYAGPMGLSTFAGDLRREGARLVFEHGTFFHIADGFAAMLAYLRDKGCTAIAYTFNERREDEEDGEAEL